MNVTNRVLPRPVGGGGFEEGHPVLGVWGPFLPTFRVCWNLLEKVSGFQFPAKLDEVNPIYVNSDFAVKGFCEVGVGNPVYAKPNWANTVSQSGIG
jgi:hypothetical protein